MTGREKVVAPKTGTPRRVLAPTVAMLLIVDKSGSMAGHNITLVKEACIESARALTGQDLIGVLAFDARPKWVLPFVPANRRSYIKDQVLRLYADGGTDIHPGQAGLRPVRPGGLLRPEDNRRGHRGAGRQGAAGAPGHRAGGGALELAGRLR